MYCTLIVTGALFHPGRGLTHLVQYLLEDLVQIPDQADLLGMWLCFFLQKLCILCANYGVCVCVSRIWVLADLIVFPPWFIIMSLVK